MAGLTLDQAAASRWAATEWIAQDAVDRVVFFRSAGLPDTPPENLHRLENMTEDEFRAWMAAGFDVPAMAQLVGSTLDEAIGWRDHGFSAARAQALLQADRNVDRGRGPGVHCGRNPRTALDRPDPVWVHRRRGRRIRRDGCPAERSGSGGR